MMPTLQQLLRSRGGVGLLLAVVVAGVVVAARLLGGGPAPATLAPQGEPATTIDPTAGDDGVHAVESPSPEPTAVADEVDTTDPGDAPGDAPEVATARDVADAFAAAWLDHRDVTTERWHDALAPYTTADLAERLTDVDPVSVPADRTTGEATAIPFSDTLVEVTYPLDSGVLTLRLIAAEEEWLVDWVDWERA